MGYSQGLIYGTTFEEVIHKIRNKNLQVKLLSFENTFRAFLPEMKAGYQVIHAYTANYIPRRVSCQKHIQCARYVNPYRRCHSRSKKLIMDNDSCESPSPENFTVPIVGYEIVEKRERFTVCITITFKCTIFQWYCVEMCLYPTTVVSWLIVS